jgi:GNAT superfamily N-acetyltransferase
MITYKIANTFEERIQFCQLALSNRLYVAGWTLRNLLLAVVSKDTDPSDINVEIALAFDGGQPVGISFKNLKVIQCYVSPKYRKQGIGSELVQLLSCPYSYAYLGLDFSKDFWAKNKILCL